MNLILKQKIMAKIIAPFKIVGTLGDMNFLVDAAGNNIVREKGPTGITKKQFKENPIFDRIRQHGTEFGSCAKKSRIFRLLAKQFFDKAKEGSFAGRVNQLLFEILEEDTLNQKGERKLENGLKTKDGQELLLHFEANKTRPLHKIINKKIQFDWEQKKINLNKINPEKNILWPQPDANQLHLQLAIANWNYKEDTFENCFSNEIILEKTATSIPLKFEIKTPSAENLWVAFLFIGFSNKERKKTKLLHKKWNTATIISTKLFDI